MRKLTPELGELIEVHRPLSWWKGWAWVLAIPVLLSGGLLIGGQFRPTSLVLTAAALFVVTLVVMAIAFAEMFLIKFQIYRRGIVFSCDLSFPYGYKDYVLPYWRCDPDSLKALKRGKETDAAVEGFVGQHYRLIPLAAYNIRLEGPPPWEAADIAAGKTDFIEHIPDDVSDRVRDMLLKDSLSGLLKRRWLFTSRDPHRHVELLDQLIRAEHERLGLTDRAESGD